MWENRERRWEKGVGREITYLVEGKAEYERDCPQRVALRDDLLSEHVEERGDKPPREAREYDEGTLLCDAMVLRVGRSAHPFGVQADDTVLIRDAPRGSRVSEVQRAERGYGARRA